MSIIKTEQELREQFEKWEKNRVFFMNTDPMFHSFKQGYSLAQETIKTKDAEIERLRQKHIQELINIGMELINKANFKFLWQDETEQLEEKAKAWLEENK